MVLFIILLLIISNIILIYFLNKKKIKLIFNKSKIEEKNISELHNIFKLKKINDNLLGPKKNVIINSFCITPENNVVGMTSDYEAWIIASLSKISQNIFEFGTCSGKTTYLMALNSPLNSKITSITLDPEEINQLSKNSNDNSISHRNIINESIYKSFLFSGEEFESKISVIFKNSLNLETSEYKNTMDLIFIDGGHTYSVVKNDTEKSFEMINSKGIILWHDYVPGKESAKDVVKYLNEISKNKKIYRIKNTSLCFYQNL
jgi:predicted O-methyltransferase YrrM